MTIIECTEEKYALNLNPYQVFIFINEKTKPYLEQFKDLQAKTQDFEIVLLPFEAAEAQQVVDDSVDPQLYNVISHSDVVARMMPKKIGDYHYMTETFFKGKNYDFDYMNFKIEEFMLKMKGTKNYSYVNTIRRFFQYGNQEFSDFVMDVYHGDLKKMMEMAERYCHMGRTGDYLDAEQFTRGFLKSLDDSKRELLDEIVKDALNYNCPKESAAVFSDYIYQVFDNNSQTQLSLSSREKSIKAPDFNIVISPSTKKKLADAEGDYDIQVVKDNGEIIPLTFGYRGDKMIYLLTLLCQKAVDGLPNSYFTNDISKNAIKDVYDEVFRSGGDVWVETMKNDSHRISMSRTHANDAIDDNLSIDLSTGYWCKIETIAKYIGPKNKKLWVRVIRLPKERILFKDDGVLTDCLADIPSFEQIVGFVSPNSAKILEIKKILSQRNGGIDRYDVDE